MATDYRPLRISPHVHQALKAFAQKTGRSHKWIGDTAILDWLSVQPESDESHYPKTEQQEAA